MADGIKFKVDTREFDKTMREYVNYSKRDISTIVNTKAYYIARRAVAETPLAESKEIREFIKRDSGRIAGSIINARRGQRGEKGLYGKEMAKAVATMLASRLRARAFIKSGWLWAVKVLAPHAEKIGGPSLGKGKPELIGKPKGGATPAVEGWSVRASIINTVTAAWDKRDGAAKVAEPALERAFEFERQSMLGYIERKLRGTAKSSGIRTN
jgi:hypothetical protein